MLVQGWFGGGDSLLLACMVADMTVSVTGCIAASISISIRAVQRLSASRHTVTGLWLWRGVHCRHRAYVNCSRGGGVSFVDGSLADLEKGRPCTSKDDPPSHLPRGLQ